MRAYVFLSIALSALLYLTGCNKEDCPDVYTETPPELADWFVFPEGSWWAYENDKNDRIDTLWYFLTKSWSVSSVTYESNCDQGFRTEVQYNLNPNYSPTNFGYVLVDCYCGSSVDDCSVRILPKVRGNRDLLPSTFISYNPSESFFYSTNDPAYVQVIAHDSLLGYGNSIIVEDSFYVHPFAFSKGVGMIRFGHNDTLFTLIDYSGK